MLRDNKKYFIHPSTTSVFAVAGIILIFFQRIWLCNKLPIIFILFAGISIYLYIQNKLTINKKNLFIFGLLAVTTALSSFFVTVFNKTNVSFLSLAYLILIYIFFTLRPSEYVNCDIKRILLLWNNCIVFCALIGIIQFVLNSKFDYLLDLTSFIPHDLLAHGFGSIAYIAEDESLVRPNGLFFLEPSFFSQFLAISIVIETLYFKRIVRLVLFIGTLLLTFSGTGLLIIIFYLSLTVIAYSKEHKLNYKILLECVAALLCVYLFWIFLKNNQEILVYFVNRIREIFANNIKHSSGHIRFIEPFLVSFSIAKTSLFNFFFGLGPGIKHLHKYLQFELCLFAPANVFIYYGFPSLIIYLGYIINSSFYGSLDKKKFLLLATILFMYCFCSAALLTPNIVFITLWFTWLLHTKQENNNENSIS